jgi:hypothetical protein
MNDLRNSLVSKIWAHIQNVRAAAYSNMEAKAAFEALALQIFDYQYKFNPFYREYSTLIGKDFSQVSHLADIPFLPIQFFKNHIIKTGEWSSQTVFSSSGTTGSTTSQHHVRHLDFYKDISRQGFEHQYGRVADYCILGLLPSYLERTGSSLITMVADFIERSAYPESGFFLDNYAQLAKILRGCRERKIPTLLIGVSFALLDFAESQALDYDFPELIVMETGGMKGRRREMIRDELHAAIAKGFYGQKTGEEPLASMGYGIHSEYGMTELFSQAYAKQDGIFKTTPTLHVLSRDINDPLSTRALSDSITTHMGSFGALNIVDLANLDTCSFIATDDLGKAWGDTFTVLGRLDNSDVRGCNLMVAQV